MVESKAKEYVHGEMEENTKDHGLTTRNMDMEFSLGLMVENTRATIRMIRSMVQELIRGRMEEST